MNRRRISNSAACVLLVLATLCDSLLRADDASWAIYVMQNDGGNTRRVCHVEGFLAHGSPRWSHDGKQLAFDANNGPGGLRRVFVVNLAGDGLRNVAEHATPDWSPDDKQLLFMRYGREPTTWVQNFDGQGATRLAIGACPRWSGDGSQMLYMDATEQKLLALDLASGEERVLLEGKYERIEPGFDWSSDAKRVAIIGVGPNDNRELLILEPGDVKRVRLNKGRLEGAISWSPDDKRLALSVDFKIVIVEVESNSPPRAVAGQIGRSTDPAWSPDGKWFAFASDRADEK